MSILPIYLYGSKMLHKKARPVSGVTDEIVALVVDMHQTMRNAQGIGLAATQVGRLHRVIVVDLSGMEEMKDARPMTMINPEIVSRSGESSMEEGCLSIPDVRDDVDRAGRISVRYRDTNFTERELEAEGILARVILHEVDHLDGILFLDRLPEARRKLHDERLKALRRGEADVAYPVVTGARVTA